MDQKFLTLNKSNNTDKQAYKVVLGCTNNGLKLPPLIIFNGKGTTLEKRLDKLDCEFTLIKTKILLTTLK